MDFTWTSIADWLVRAGLGGSLLIVCTLLAMRWVPQPARRQRLGELGLAAALVLAALCWGPAWLPLWQPAAAPAATLEMVCAPAAQPGDDDVLEDCPLALDIAPVQPLAEAMPASASFHLVDWLLPAVVIAYSLGAMFYLARWLAGVVVLWRIVRAAQPATPELLADLETRWQGRRQPRLLISTKLQVPASCGVFRPTLILPAALATADHVAERDWVFDHELTHLARRDAWSAVLFALGQMLYFALPWFWWLKRIVRLCQEYVADAAACRRRPADEYAEFLLSLTTAPAAPLAATGVTGTSSDLYRRVAMLLQNPVRVELTCPRVWTVGAAGVLLGLAVIAAGVGPAQAQQPNQKEVLEQLERIQDMVNKLRHQLADQSKDVGKKSDKPHVIVVDVDALKAKEDDQIRDAKAKADAAVRKAFLFLEKAQVGEAEKQRAQADLERAQVELQLKLRQIEQQAADPKKAADKQKLILELELATEERQHRLAIAQLEHARQYNQQRLIQLGGADKELKQTLEVLQKHLADLKDGDAATKKAIQDAVNRLKDVKKKQTVVFPAAPAQPYPTIIRTPATPAVPAVPAPPATPKPGVVVTAPAGEYRLAQTLGVIAGDDHPARVWAYTAQQPTGRLGIRVDAPGAILADQLNLPKDQGLVIAEVYEKSVAQKAGIKANDILLKINQQPVSNDPQKLIKQVGDIKADMPFDIVVLRRGKQETIQNVRLPEPTPRATAVRALTGWRDLAADSKNVRVTITAKHTGNTLTLLRNEGGVGITVTADVADGKTKVTGISIVEKDKTSKYASVNEVPEPNRAKVQHLLQLLDSVSLPTPAPAIPDRKGASGKQPSAGADIDPFYRIPSDAKPGTTKTIELLLDGAGQKLTLPVEELPSRNAQPLALPNAKIELDAPAGLRFTLPKAAPPKAPQINP